MLVELNENVNITSLNLPEYDLAAISLLQVYACSQTKGYSFWKHVMEALYNPKINRPDCPQDLNVVMKFGEY